MISDNGDMSYLWKKKLMETTKKNDIFENDNISYAVTTLSMFYPCIIVQLVHIVYSKLHD